MNKKFFVLVLLSAVGGFFLGQNLKSNFFNLELFQAAVVSSSPQNLLPEETAAPEGSEPRPTEAGRETEPELTLAEIQEILDDIAEKIDVINQEIAELIVEIQETAEQEAVKEEEMVTEEELEDEEEKEGICLDGIDINTASKEELEKIAGVGPVIAQRIIDARPFYSFNDLLRVSGIGEKTLQGIIDQGCAYIDEFYSGYGGGGGGGGGGGSPPPATYLKILISEIQISPIEQRFIELYNPNESEVNLTNWYIQRKTKTATSWASFVTSTQFEGKTIQPKSYFLISGTLENSDIFLTDLTLTEDNSLVLKNPNGDIVDLIGWGEAQDYEDSPAENPPPGKSVGRKWNSETQEYQDTDNNQTDFEIQTPTPKSQNQSPEPEPEPEVDTTPPEVVFKQLDSTQTSLFFTIYFELTDSALETVTPSGLDGFVFRWKEEDGDWQEDDYQKVEEAPMIYSGQRQFEGEDEKIYSFQIKAKDIAGNESEWVEISTRISIPKIVLINEIQIDSVVGIGGADDDWVELFNPNDVDVSLAGWSIQKHSANQLYEPCSIDKAFYKKNFESTAIIPAYGFYLIVDTQANASLLVLADMTIGWLLTDDNTVYLVRNQDKIESGEDPDIVDKVGFGLACFAETEPFLNPPEAKSIERRELGLDTNDNSQDFEINDIPTPTNSKGE